MKGSQGQEDFFKPIVSIRNYQDSMTSEKIFYRRHRKIYVGFLFMFLVILLSPASLRGQKNEFGVLFGGTYYLGDLNPSRQFAMTHVGLGGMYRHNFNPHISARINGIFTSVEGNDALIKYNEDRNLRFVSNITELSGQFEVNFLPYEPGNLDTPYSPYIFAGGGIFWFNPQAQFPDTLSNGTIEWVWTPLRKLGTEGQGTEGYPDKYKPFSHQYLFGIGLKFNISRNITGGIEWGMRRTGTDYLDDVSTKYPDISVFEGSDNYPQAIYFHDRSIMHNGQNAGIQRGDPTVNDWYSFAGFFIAFKIKDSTRAKCSAYN